MAFPILDLCYHTLSIVFEHPQGPALVYSCVCSNTNGGLPLAIALLLSPLCPLSNPATFKRTTTGPVYFGTYHTRIWLG